MSKTKNSFKLGELRNLRSQSRSILFFLLAWKRRWKVVIWSYRVTCLVYNIDMPVILVYANPFSSHADIDLYQSSAQKSDYSSEDKMGEKKKRNRIAVFNLLKNVTARSLQMPHHYIHAYLKQYTASRQQQ